MKPAWFFLVSASLGIGFLTADWLPSGATLLAFGIGGMLTVFGDSVHGQDHF